MDHIKEAFAKVKQDISSMKEEILNLKEEISKLNQSILHNNLNLNKTKDNLISSETQDIETNKASLKGLKHQYLPFSTGNEGVPTDRQTYRQTDRQTQYDDYTEENKINSATEILESLDALKKEVRIKFKRLTEQEMLVFSTMYQLDEEQGYSDYKTLSLKLNLTESSIRDYVGRIIKKGIPVDKIKVNNKNIRLNISLNLKKIASLSTILQLRGI